MKQKTGILLIQLGTPDEPTTSSVRTYLKEFLMDPRVVDIPKPLRWLLVHGIIAPFRSPKSAAAYQKIWMATDSPLRFYSLELRNKLQKLFGDDIKILLGMRYGKPSIDSALDELLKLSPEKIVIVPLYPQYASSSFGSSLEAVFTRLSRSLYIPAIEIVPPFYTESFFIDSWISIASKFSFSEFDHVLFSFHGLPERHILNTDPTKQICKIDASCCEQDFVPNHCYRAQSFSTAHAIAKKLQIPREKYSVSFQSRLGRTPWLQPFTDVVLTELPNKGIKKLAVFSPSFVADCLETLEEIAIRGKELFVEAGGSELVLIPSLNSSDIWANSLWNHLKKYTDK